MMTLFSQRSLRRSVPFCLALIPALFACSKEPEQAPPNTGQYMPANNPNAGGQGAVGQPNSGQPYGGQVPQPGAAGQPASGQAGQVGTLGPVASDPNVLQNIIAGALSGGAAALGALTGGELGPIQAGIKAKAGTVAKGMKPEGELFSAKLQQGGHAEGTLTLQPGACYTIIGFGNLGVFDFQINLITAPPMPPQVLAQSPTGAVDPVIGAGDQCIKNPYPLPLPVKVDMTVIRGQGTVGAQAYKK